MFFHLKRDLPLHHCFYYCSCICMNSEQNRNLLFFYAILLTFLYLFKNIFCLFHRIFHFLNMKAGTAFTVCFQFFTISLHIIFNEFQRILYDICCRTVIHSKQNLFCIREILSKSKHQFRISSTKSVDCLVIIPHYEQIILRLGQHTDHIILNSINILKFINQNVSEFLLPLCKYIWS